MQIGVTGDEEVVFVCVTSVKVRRRVTSRTVTLIFLATPRRWNLGNEIFRCTYSTYSPIDSFIHFSATLSSMFTFSLGLYLRPNWSGGKKKKKKSLDVILIWTIFNFGSSAVEFWILTAVDFHNGLYTTTRVNSQIRLDRSCTLGRER